MDCGGEGGIGIPDGPKWTAQSVGWERNSGRGERSQDRFDTAYDAFRDLANGLYHIDLRRYSRGVTSEDWTGEAARVGAFA